MIESGRARITTNGTAAGTSTGRERFAARWAEAVIGTSFVPMSAAEIQQFLARLTDLLGDALVADPFRTEPGYEVGKALVDAHFVSPETLEESLGVIGSRLLGLLGLRSLLHGATSDFAVRLARLQGAIAAGYTKALRQRTLDEQEMIRHALMAAREDAVQALRVSETRFRTVFAGAPVGMGIASMDGLILEVNRALADLLGYEPSDLLGMNIFQFSDDQDDPERVADFREGLMQGKLDQVRMQKRMLRRDGGEVWTQATASLIRDKYGNPRYCVSMFSDITEQLRLTRRLEHQANHDPLTGLPNRTLFYDTLTAALARGGDRIGLCYLDLDGFKVFNDSLGHDVGDRLLVKVADRLSHVIADSGHLVARMGGDEFVILVERPDSREQVIRLADAALAALRPPVEIDGHHLSVSASVGIVERAVVGTTAADLMKAADITLYWAKSDGGDRWALYDPDRNARAVARYTLSATMPAALDRREFYLDYQPLVSLADGSVMGLEALVRWQHPRHGLIPPGRFIGLAEETGLIVALGRWVLEEACQQAGHWRHDRSAPPFISVNLAVRQLRDRGLVDDVKRILAETGLPASALQLELTESAVMGSPGEPLDALLALSEMGIRIAIDDFGTGYSNLSYLRRLPLHALKIAGSFVAGLRSPAEPDPVGERIVATLVDLAHTLGLTVIAEGVETEAQAQRLRTIGCDAAQGWHFARAMSPDQVAPLLTA